MQGDVDKDGYLDCAEFVAISVHLRKLGNDDHLRKAFEFFDRNETGYLEIEDLRDAFADEVEATSEEVIHAIIQDVDTDKVSYPVIPYFCWNKILKHPTLIITFVLLEFGLNLLFVMFVQDGRISYEEFAAMMKSGTDWRKASRQYSRERYNSLSLKLMEDASLQMSNETR